MDLKDALAEADTLLVSPELISDYATVMNFLAASSGWLSENTELRFKSTAIATRAAGAALLSQKFEECLRIIAIGRQLAQTSAEIFDLEISALKALMSLGNRPLALAKLKLLNERQKEMNSTQLEEFAALRLYILRGRQGHE